MTKSNPAGNGGSTPTAPVNRDAMLEQNVGSLLGAYDPPRLADGARARIRAALVTQHAQHARRAAPRRATPLYAIGFGLAAAAAVAVVVGALVGSDRIAGGGTAAPLGGKEVALADGSSVLLDTGARVDVLGPRRVRITGAALLDVAKGKGQFIVETEHGTLAVLGTKFVVEAGANRTLAAVIRGAVRLESSAGKVELRAGEQGIAEPGRAPTRGPAPRLSHLASWAAQARKRADGAAPTPVRNGTLYAREPNFQQQEFPLPMSQLTVDAVVDHQVARVALDQTFENPQPRELEGMYRFAIPSDAALQRFAMYVDGKLTESAVVERMRARRIYEELVYRRVDPGLLEYSGAGRLALRIFPLRAQADKRIVLAYTQSLPRLYDDWTLTVPLPEVDATVDDVVFNVRVKGCAGCELHSPSHAVEVKPDGEDAVVSYHGRGETIGDSLVLVARDQRTAAQVATHTTGGERYVVVRARPDLGTAAAAATATTASTHRPRSWVIVDDISASRGPTELAAQADVVEGLLRELDEDDRVAVLTVDSLVREQGGLTRVDDVDHRAVRAFLTADDVGGVGATDLGAAFDRATALLAGVDARDAYVIYLGDGVVTGGDRGLAALRARLAGKATFVGVGIGDGADTPTLAALADATGGSVYTMDLADDLPWRTFDLVASLYTARVTGLTASLVDAGGAPITGQVTYLRAGQLGDGEELELVARVPAGATPAAVALAGNRDGAAWQSRIALDAAPASDGAYLPRLWAQRHVAALMLAKEDAVTVPPCAAQPCPTEDELRAKHREELRQQIVALGKQFFLLSRHTSLLVLENEAMYAQYGVTKGSGDTWAPYEVPATVEVKQVAAASTTPNIDPGAGLVRTPVPLFFDYSAYYQEQQNRFGGMPMRTRTNGIGVGMNGGSGRGRVERRARIDNALDAGEVGLRVFQRATEPRGDLSRDTAGAELAEGKLGKTTAGADEGNVTEVAKAEEEARNAGPISVVTATSQPDPAQLRLEGATGTGTAAVTTAPAASAPAPVVTTGALRQREMTWMVDGDRQQAADGWFDDSLVGGEGDGRWSWGQSQGQPPSPIALHYPTDPRLDDLTEWVPAMFTSAVDVAAAQLVRAAGGAKGSIDAAARALIDRARAALPAGTYRIGDGPAIAVSGGSLSWRLVDANGLEQLARLDGTTWRRAYPELGLEVSHDLGARAPAVTMTYLPLYLPEADQLATWFAITTKGTSTLVLAPAADPTHPVFEIELDARARVVAVRSAAGTVQLAVTWGSQGPTAISVAGVAESVGFTPSIDPVTIPADVVTVALPLAQPARAQELVAAAAAGTPAWRAAQRQVMATAAAIGDPSAAWVAYDALLGQGGVALGDLVLAARGVAVRTDADFARALAPFGGDAAARPAFARYLDAARRYGKQPRPEALAPAVDTGLVGTMWRYRHLLALVVANKREAAVAAIEAMGDRAPELRAVAAATIAQRWDWPAALVGRAWDAAARGAMRNIARYEAARAVYNRGDYAAAAERFTALLNEIDLAAAPVTLDYTALNAFHASPRGQAGFDMAWRGFTTRVLADGDFADVMALAASTVMVQRGDETDRVLGRAADLAAGDRGKLIAVVELAVAHGQTERANALLPALLAGDPDPTIERLAMAVALSQGKPGEAAEHLARAISAADGPAPLAEVRADYAQLIALRGRVAQLASGPARDQAVTAMLATSRAWRAIDPANSQIDSQVGELLLDLDRPDEAWRQLSTAIERDPLDGAGWILVADALERHGRYDQALATWQEAIVIDQTNPGPRLRKAQLYYALGRTAEGDALVKDAAARRWHDRFFRDGYQLTELARQRKLLGSDK